MRQSVSYKHIQSRLKTAVSILIVDDEPQVSEFVRFVLEDAGYETRVALSGPSAIDAVAASGYPDLLLTDVKMPQMHGDELAARLRRERPELKVLYLTGLSQELFRHRDALDEGEAVLEKPCSAKEILQGVLMLLSRPAVASSVRSVPHVRRVGRAGPPDV